MKEIIDSDKTFIIYPGWVEGFIIAYRKLKRDGVKRHWLEISLIQTIYIFLMCIFI